MGLQVMLQAEWYVALSTHEVFGIGVQFFVRFQVIKVFKCFSTRGGLLRRAKRAAKFKHFCGAKLLRKKAYFGTFVVSFEKRGSS